MSKLSCLTHAIVCFAIAGVCFLLMGCTTTPETCLEKAIQLCENSNQLCFLYEGYVYPGIAPEKTKHFEAWVDSHTSQGWIPVSGYSILDQTKEIAVYTVEDVRKMK